MTVYTRLSSPDCSSSGTFALTLASRSCPQKDIATARQGLRRRAEGGRAQPGVSCSPRHTESQCLTTRSCGRRPHLRGETWSERSHASWPRQARRRAFSRMTSARSPVRADPLGTASFLPRSVLGRGGWPWPFSPVHLFFRSMAPSSISQEPVPSLGVPDRKPLIYWLQ